jgi:hypothetical protein
MSFLNGYFRDVILILTEPKRFFEERYPELSFSQALVIGVLSNWIAAFLMWLTRIVKHESLLDGMRKMREILGTLPIWKDLPDSIWQQGGGGPQSFLSSSMLELGPIAISPFQSLINFCVRGLILMLGVYLLVPRRASSPQTDSVSPSTLIRLNAVAVTPILVGAILGFLPFMLGGLIGGIYTFVILLVGVSTRYRVSYARAAGAIILPYFILIFFCGCLAFGFSALLGGILGGLFAGH